MRNNTFLSIGLTRKEITWGVRYLLFQSIFLAPLLQSINWLLPSAMNAAQLNFLFFTVNFLVVLWIFQKYLLQFLHVDFMDVLRILAVGSVFFALYWWASTLLSELLIWINPDFANINDQSIIAMSQGNYTLMFIGTVIFVPITEECLHRGLIFRGLYSRSPLAAFAVSTTVFCLIHVINYAGYPLPALILSFMQYIPAGLCLAGAYRLSGSLLCPIVIHAAINAMGMLALR